MRVRGVDTKPLDLKYGPEVFQRGDEELVFYAQPVWSFDEFEALVPFPENDTYVFTPKGKEKDWDSPSWKQKQDDYNRKRWGWFVLKALEPSEIEWSKVSLDDPDTFVYVEDELRESLLPVEFTRVMNLAEQASSLDARKLEENRESFLRRQARRTEDGTQSGEATSTSSSEPA